MEGEIKYLDTFYLANGDKLTRYRRYFNGKMEIIEIIKPKIKLYPDDQKLCLMLQLNNVINELKRWRNEQRNS